MGTKERTSVLRFIPRWAGALIVFYGLLTMAGWHAHWREILQWIPNTAPMQFNTGLCFVLCGTSLFLLTTERPQTAPWPGIAAAVLSALTLLEYVTGRDLGIDVLFCNPYFEFATGFPGRMSPLASVCFISTGATLAFLGGNRNWRHRLAIAGVLSCMVCIISFVAVVGFIFSIESAYGWGAFSSMAVSTAALFLLLSTSLLGLNWSVARLEKYNFLPRLLPLTASVTLMIMVVFVAAGSVRRLKAATYWRKHTIQTILTAQALQNDVLDLQRGARGYIMTGDTNAYASFKTAAALEPEELKKLATLTRDNAAQQETLRNFEGAMKFLLAHNYRLLQMYSKEGPAVALRTDLAIEGRNLFGSALGQLKEFVEAEQKLLDLREHSEESDYGNTERLLVFACIMAAVLLLTANYMAGLELARRQRAESKLAEQAESLRRSNAELEQFAYVASHDLREPLRAMSGFAQILKAQSKNKLGPEDNLAVERIVEGAKRMGTIIDDLLALSRIGSKGNAFEKISLEKPLRLAMDNLSVAVAEKGATIRHDALPAVLMDASQVALVFQNLIGNAIKFCANRPPEITIAAQREADGPWKISVRDNGIGIEPKYFDKIFGIFQRLHSREAYPGTGIGLAICKKIVERHGGRIWLESMPGEGSTFYFTLAEQPREKYDGEQ